MRTIILLACLLAVAFAKVRFDGYRVVYIPSVSLGKASAIENAGLDVWAEHPSETGDGVALDVMINDESEKLLKELGLTYTTKIADVQANIDREQREIEAYYSSAHANTDETWYTAYHNYSDIVTKLTQLAAAYPNLVTYNPSIGKSVEGRDIPAIIIDTKASTRNKYFHVIGGQHAREWVGPATVLYVAETLITTYATDASVKAILDRAAIYIVPLANPDGYFFTWANTGNRLWRKNRSRNTGGSFGTDLNRNWDDGHWGGGGSSSSPTSDTYHGTSANSEPETKALVNFVNGAGVKFSGAIDWHSYSQLILRPAGWTNTPTVNETVLSTVGTGVRTAILGVNNVPYTSQRSYQLYQTTGTSTDYWYAKSNIVFSYCIELRDTGNYGFQLPANQILPTGKENFAAFKYFTSYIIQNNW